MKEALIYAAGFGTRMGALTKNTPKPMLELNGKPIIAHVKEMLAAGGVEKFHINTHYLGHKIQDYFDGDASVLVHDEPAGPYETGGTLKSLASQLPDAIITMNSDALFSGANPVPTLLESWNDDIDALLLCLPVEKAQHYGGSGDFYIDNGAPVWKGDRPHAPFVFTGLQIIRPKIAEQFADQVFSSKIIWQKLMDEKRIGATIYHGNWIDIGTKEALEAARLMIEKTS